MVFRTHKGLTLSHGPFQWGRLGDGHRVSGKQHPVLVTAMMGMTHRGVLNVFGGTTEPIKSAYLPVSLMLAPNKPSHLAYCFFYIRRHHGW